MTAQISDTFVYKGKEHELIGIRGGELVTPEQFGMESVMLHTACYCGYFATYALTDEGLYLKEFTLREATGNYLPIGGIEATKEEHQATYHDLKMPVPFTGKIRLARGFIRKYYVHMGYQKPTAFKTVLDITLNEGKVTEIRNRSREMKEKRGAFKEQYESGDMMESIDDAFSLDLDLE